MGGKIPEHDDAVDVGFRALDAAESRMPMILEDEVVGDVVDWIKGK
jgi:hypothetical protein